MKPYIYEILENNGKKHSLTLKGYLGEDLYGEWTEPVVSAFRGIEI